MKTQELIDRLSLYIGEETARMDILYLKSLGCSFRFINSFIGYQKEKWNVENVKSCYDMCGRGKNSSNNYNPNYVSKKFCISDEDAKDKIKEFKQSKNTSLDGFKKRWGPEEGLKKFKKFQETSKSSTEKLKQSLINEFGEEVGLEKFKEETRRRSRASPDFYIYKLGLSKEEAEKAARDHNLKNSGLFKQYYIDSGYTDDEVDAVLSKINLKKGNTTRNREFLMGKYGDSWISVYKVSSDKYRKNMEDSGRWLKLEDLSAYKKYHTLCWFWTRQTLKTENISNIEIRSIDNHLDHMFSIKRGFQEDVDPEIIGCKFNLKIIPRKENCSKSSKCSLTLESLLNFYYENKENH